MASIADSFRKNLIRSYGPNMFNTLLLEYDDLSEVMMEIMTAPELSEAVDFILDNLRGISTDQGRDESYLVLYAMSSSIIKNEILVKSELQGLDKKLLNTILISLDGLMGSEDPNASFKNTFLPLLQDLFLRSDVKLSELHIPVEYNEDDIWDLIAKTTSDPVSEYKKMALDDVYASYYHMQHRFPEILPHIAGADFLANELDSGTAMEFFEFLASIHGKFEAYKLINAWDHFVESLDIESYLEFLSSLIDKDEFVDIYGVDDVVEYLTPPFDDLDDEQQRVLIAILLKSETLPKLHLKESALEYWEHNGVGIDIYSLVDVEKSSKKTKSKYLSLDLGL